MKNIRLNVYGTGSMNCMNCKAELKEGAKFCSRCGIQVKWAVYCSDCGTGLDTDAEFCFECGAVVKHEDGTTSKKRRIAPVISFGGHDWRVLDKQNNRTLILSDKVIEIRPYHEGATWMRGITWDKSDLRAYLNGEFYDNFTPHDRAYIAETVITTGKNPRLGTRGGKATNDRIFLLSIQEALKYLGGRDHQTINKTILDQAGIVSAPWWLRSTGATGRQAAVVDEGGFVQDNGFLISVYDKIGVRPALWLNN